MLTGGGTWTCNEFKQANEYCRVDVRCELAKGHSGPHFAMLGPTSSCCWTNVSLQLNYIIDKKEK